MATGQQNGDLRATLVVSQQEARTGTTRTLMLAGGRSLTVSLPSGMTDGQEIRLDGQGEPATGGGRVGALILTIAVAPAENFGPQLYSAEENNAPTFFSVPPPPPPSADAQQSFPGNYSNYSSYPQQTQPVTYPSQQPSGSGYNLYATPPHATPYPPTPQPGQWTPGQPPVPNQPKRRSSTVTILLVLLAFLVIGAGAGIYFYTGVVQPAVLHAQATSTAQAKVTGTAQVYATATAQVNATSQAQVNATSTVQTQIAQQATATVTTLQTSYTQITGGTPTFSDPLTNPSANNWDTGQGCSFTNGAYHATESQAKFFVYCVAQSSNFSNFAYQVQMDIVKGEYGGLIFRADTVNSKFYLFRVKQDGSYDLYVYIDNKGEHAKTLANGVADNINSGLNQHNKIGVLANGNTISLYINGTFQTSVTDATLHGGQIGLIADDITAAADVAYTGAQVWKL